jgi:hypothetical protein
MDSFLDRILRRKVVALEGSQILLRMLHILGLNLLLFFKLQFLRSIFFALLSSLKLE